jgi:two-component system nitrogen regulation response regulator NtrX
MINNAEKILIIDDEPDIRSVLTDILADEGFEVISAINAEDGHQKFKEENPDLVLLDIWMPLDQTSSGTEGLQLLEKWQKENLLDKPVIMISGHGNIETAVEAVKNGAYDFLEKPLSIDSLLLTVNRAMERERLKRENESLRLKSEQQHELIGESGAIQEVRRQIRLFGPTDSWVLLSGEVGTGKSVVARSLHIASQRTGKFVQLNLAAIPGENLATRLFGIESEETQQIGCFEEANGGTLLINEVLDLDFDTQGKLLSALDEGRILRVGGKEYINFDVRIIASSSRDIEAAVKAGAFREDLYFRLNVIPIELPTLNQRGDDIRLLLSFHLERIAKQNNMNPRQLDKSALLAMQNYQWPGNTRQLINVINRLQLLNPEAVITADEFLNAVGKEANVHSGESLNIPNYFELSMREARDNFESLYLQYQLNKAEYNMTQLAKNIGMERTHLYRKLKSLGIETKK